MFRYSEAKHKFCFWVALLVLGELVLRKTDW